MVDFSVVITTRNRPELLRHALDSVLAQAGVAASIILVNDGTSGEAAGRLQALREAYGHVPITYVDLPETASGHGCYFALNAGVMRCRGEYVAFLDDDDVWTDPEYLRKAKWAIHAYPQKPDLLFFDQAAYSAASAAKGGDGRLKGPIWLEDLGRRLRDDPTRIVNPVGAYLVTVDDLMTAHGFCHVNTLVVRREFLRGLSGFDATLRYEGDREFYLRAIDRAGVILYIPSVVARHHVPDPQARTNASTSLSQMRKHLDQYALLTSLSHIAKHRAIIAYAQRHRRYARQKAAQAAAGRDWATAAKLLPMVAVDRVHRLIGG